MNEFFNISVCRHKCGMAHLDVDAEIIFVDLFAFAEQRMSISNTDLAV